MTEQAISPLRRRMIEDMSPQVPGHHQSASPPSCITSLPAQPILPTGRHGKSAAYICSTSRLVGPGGRQTHGRICRSDGAGKGAGQRRASRVRVAVTRGYSDFWQGASIDRAKLARYLPPLLDTADELKAVAGKRWVCHKERCHGRHRPIARRKIDHPVVGQSVRFTTVSLASLPRWKVGGWPRIGVIHLVGARMRLFERPGYPNKTKAKMASRTIISSHSLSGRLRRSMLGCAPHILRSIGIITYKSN
jgi:hypothetical protein